MCCFSGEVRSVSSTRIFGRRTVPGRQVLAYQMALDTEQPVAMVLPLPVPRRVHDVRFLDLSGHADLFQDLERGFEVARHAAQPGALASSLPVHRVGSFEASFVPSQAQFARLDPRFRIAPSLWPERYQDWGFAVFQLAPGAQEVHPMGLDFPCHAPRLYLPTFHLHGARPPLEADFDHSLYIQRRQAPSGWTATPEVAGSFLDTTRSEHLVDAGRPVLRRRVRGTLPNQDTWV